MMERRAEQVGTEDVRRIGEYLDQLLQIFDADRPQPLRYLDTGCGVGASLQAAEMRGLQAHGIEVDEAALEVARGRGLRVLRPDDAPPAGPFHIITFLESLEHIDDPGLALRQYGALLAPQGLLFVTVPNVASLTVRVLKEDCSYVHGGTNTPGHINLFDADSMTRLLELVGFSVIDVDTEYTDNPFELAAYVLNGQSPVSAMLKDSESKVALPQSLFQTLNAAWPAVGLIQRLTLAGPILRVVACRSEDAASYAAKAEGLSARRRSLVEAEANRILAQSTDYAELAKRLQIEINVRDEMLARMQKRFPLFRS
jgi:SAM-dependent methyltransferase